MAGLDTAIFYRMAKHKLLKRICKLGLGMTLGFLLAYHSGFGYYKTITPDQMQEVKPTNIQGRSLPRSYSNMSADEAVESVEDIEGVKNYFDWLGPRAIGTSKAKHSICTPGFERIHKGDAYIDCKAGAVSAARLLGDNGYPPYILYMRNWINGHIVFIYKKDGKYGTAGLTDIDFCEGKDSVDDIVKAHNYSSYLLMDLDKQYFNWKGDGIDVLTVVGSWKKFKKIEH